MIRLAAPCLRCHGPAEGIAPEIRAAIEKNYPHDKATGYKRGDIRGAFRYGFPWINETRYRYRPV